MIILHFEYIRKKNGTLRILDKMDTIISQHRLF